jgi:hypothetical protein
MRSFIASFTAFVIWRLTARFIGRFDSLADGEGGKRWGTIKDIIVSLHMFMVAARRSSTGRIPIGTPVKRVVRTGGRSNGQSCIPCNFNPTIKILSKRDWPTLERFAYDR